jgi:hypothetical protein
MGQLHWSPHSQLSLNSMPSTNALRCYYVPVWGCVISLWFKTETMGHWRFWNSEMLAGWPQSRSKARIQNKVWILTLTQPQRGMKFLHATTWMNPQDIMPRKPNTKRQIFHLHKESRIAQFHRSTRMELSRALDGRDGDLLLNSYRISLWGWWQFWK